MTHAIMTLDDRELDAVCGGDSGLNYPAVQLDSRRQE